MTTVVTAEQKSLPVDRSRTFYEFDYPQIPCAYTPLTHFLQRKREPERFLHSDVINETISNGELRDNGDGCACFVKEWGKGVSYYLIAGFHEKGYRILITGWPHLHDRTAAVGSGLWEHEELNRIEDMNARYREDQLHERYPEYTDWLAEQWKNH